MPTKLSDFLQGLGDKKPELSDLVDDETGLSLTDMRSKFKELTEGIKQIEQLKREIADRDGRLGQYQQENESYRRTLDATRQNLNGGQQQSTVDRSWANDPLYRPLVGYLDHLERTLLTSAQALAQMHNEYIADRKFVIDHLNKGEIRRMKADFKDFDENKITEHARRKNFANRSWEDVYRDWKTEQYPGEIEAARKEEREKTIKELNSRSSEPPVTEGGGHPPPPAINENGNQTKDYNSAWKGLVEDIKGLGFGA